MRIRCMLLGVVLLVSFGQSVAQVNGTGFKIAIIDTGLIRGFHPTTRVIDQMCVSRSDKLSEDSYSPQLPDNTAFPSNGPVAWFDYERASTCRNGVTRDLGSDDAAEVPRRTWHQWGDYNWNNFSSSHGTNVAQVASANAIGAN